MAAAAGVDRGHAGMAAESNTLSAAVPLAALRPHHCGWVLEVHGDDDDNERIMAMGLCAGRRVELVQHGDPLIVKVYGTRIGVAAQLAKRVLVRPCLSPHCPAANDPAGNAST